MTLLLVSLGALIGAPARYLTDRAVQSRFGSALPWGTLTVNVLASFVLGGLLGAGPHLDAHWLAFLGTGVCGTLSTYSTFSYETMRLYQRGTPARAVANVAVSLVAGIGAAAAGWALVGGLT